MIHLGPQWRSRNWVSNKKCQAVSNKGVYESNDQNEVTELSDSENNCICLHALELEGHRYWDKSTNRYPWSPWEALELVGAVMFDFGIFSSEMILQGLTSELLTKMTDRFFDKILFISLPQTLLLRISLRILSRMQLFLRHPWVLCTLWAMLFLKS